MKRLLPLLVAISAVVLSGQIQFADVARPAGTPFTLDNGAKGNFHLIELMVGGVAVLDVDNDGCLDVFFTNGASLPDLRKSGPQYANRLYRNNCKLEFQDITDRAKVAGEGYSMGAAAADFDNDGHTDLFVAGVNRNLLYRNNGNGDSSFTDITRAAGLDPPAGTRKPWSVAAGWFDYNNDGKLDLFVVNYLNWDAATEPRCGNPDARFYCHPNAFQGLANQLYRNNGDGTFTDVSKHSGIADHVGKGMGVAFADFDGDGWTDAYVANDSSRAFLFRNNGDGTFREIALEAGVAYRDDGAAIAGMGVDFRDYSNDGAPDLLITGMVNDTFLLFRNLGARWQFDDDRARTGLLLGTRPYTGWGLGIFDFDNDGWKDLFFALSHFPRLERYLGRNAELACRVFRGMEGKRFNDVSATAGADLQKTAFHHGAAFGDLDNDGRVDAVVSVVGGPARLFRNTTPPAGNHWLALRLRGVRSNRQGLGSRVQVTLPDGRVLSNHATTSVGYASSSEPVVRFGLGRFDKVSAIEIRWPSGIVQKLGEVGAGKVMEVVEEATRP